MKLFLFAMTILIFIVGITVYAIMDGQSTGERVCNQEGLEFVKIYTWTGNTAVVECLNEQGEIKVVKDK